MSKEVYTIVAKVFSISESEVNDFYKKREERKGVGRVHPEGETMYLIRTKPQYVRAEGWQGSRAIVYKEF